MDKQTFLLTKVKGLNDKSTSFGVILNRIQDKAEKVLSEKEWNNYLRASSKDADRCAGMDGILLNGHYFDWKEFEVNKKQIVSAYLDYFSEAQLGKIAEVF